MPNVQGLIVPDIFSDELVKKIFSCVERLRDTADFHAPLVWRSLVPELASLDLHHDHATDPSISTFQLMDVFRFFGGLSLDLRDVPGLGHGRLLNLVGRHHFEEPLGRIASGVSFAAVCITEVSGGSDLHSLRTVAKRHTEGYLLNGRKQFVSRLRQADYYIVFAKLADLDHGLTVFLVPAITQGVVIEDIPALGLTGCSWGGLELKDVYVPRSQRVGGEGQGFSLFSTHFGFWRCAMAAAAIGSAQSALNAARLRLQMRTAFDGPIGRFTHLQQENAKHAARIHMAWLLVQSTAMRMDHKLHSYVDAAMSKAESIEAAIAAAQWALLVHGAQGYAQSSGLGKICRDLLGLRVADGVTDVLRGQVARGLLGEQLYNQSLGRVCDAQSPIRERQLW
jgi:alkylation response protein AidB-like acyl-CoA dehydrogenase